MHFVKLIFPGSLHGSGFNNNMHLLFNIFLIPEVLLNLMKLFSQLVVISELPKGDTLIILAAREWNHLNYPNSTNVTISDMEKLR